MRDCREQTGVEAGFLVQVRSRAQDEVSPVKLQVRLADQARYPHVLWPLRWTIAHSTWMVPLLQNEETKAKTIRKDPCDSKGYTLTRSSSYD